MARADGTDELTDRLVAIRLEEIELDRLNWRISRLNALRGPGQLDLVVSGIEGLPSDALVHARETLDSIDHFFLEEVEADRGEVGQSHQHEHALDSRGWRPVDRVDHGQAQDGSR